MEHVHVSERTPARCDVLSEKEKQTLRLMVRGHDAKSMARQLGLSVHTVNERLRDARRKLEVSSSREAARLLFDAEGGDPPKNIVDNQLGEATDTMVVGQGTTPNARLSTMRWPGWLFTGVVLMTIIIGLLAVSAMTGVPATTNASPVQASTSVAVGESQVVKSAREWLELGDQGRWKDGWLATDSSFRKLNTVELWTTTSEKVRVPLGEMISRTALSQESVPAPPAGVEVVKFRTSFANKADAIETVSLAREGAEWRVVGIYLD